MPYFFLLLLLLVLKLFWVEFGVTFLIALIVEIAGSLFFLILLAIEL